MECAPGRAQAWLDAHDLDLGAIRLEAVVALVEQAGLQASVLPYGTERTSAEQHDGRLNLRLTAAGRARHHRRGLTRPSEPRVRSPRAPVHHAAVRKAGAVPISAGAWSVSDTAAVQPFLDPAADLCRRGGGTPAVMG